LFVVARKSFVRRRRRVNIVNEIVATEKSYIEHLQVVNTTTTTTTTTTTLKPKLAIYRYLYVVAVGQ
jgi:GTP cyclohydrolase III